jgi:SAM-dependent methyltransferase
MDHGAALTAMPTSAELEAVFRSKYGDPAATGWSPRRRHGFGYFLPADIYEAVVARHSHPGCHWLDVGGGHAIFPENPTLAKELVARCSRVVAVDPSDNVHRNPFVHERVQSFLEDFATDTSFDLATLRMVVEHVERPGAFTAALGRLVRPGGRVVVFTVQPLGTDLGRFAPAPLPRPSPDQAHLLGRGGRGHLPCALPHEYPQGLAARIR